MMRPFLRVLSAATVIAALAAPMASAGLPGAGPPHLLRYRVNHATYGDIGTYTNTIEQHGDTTTIQTRAHFEVTVLGIVLHREDAERSERWYGDRLVRYHSVTRKNGATIVVDGEARGDGFVITSPLGTMTAPASIRPANPWSDGFLASRTMMRVDTGAIEPVKILGAGETNVNISGATVRTRRYDIDGQDHYKVWLDREEIPVMFSVDSDQGLVTFILAEEQR